MTLRQDEAYELLTNHKDLSVLYGGAKGGGKSFLLCLWVLAWCKHLIDIFGIKTKLPHPLPVGFIGRKRGVDFDKTTLETWKKIIPVQSYEIREQDKEIVIDKKVKVFFGGLDDQETINKFNSAEFAFFAIDQAEETDRSELSVLQASLRLKYNGVQPAYKKLYTANPAECWLKEDFIVNPRVNHFYIPALPTDNPHLPDNYIATLEESFSFDPILLEAYKNGNWELLQSHAALITQNDLSLLKDIHIENTSYKRIVACDPAIGGDECVMYYMEDYDIKDTLILHVNDTQKIGAEAISFMHKHNCDYYVGDAIGVGKGVNDYVRASGKKVLDLISSAQAMDAEHNANVRAEIWSLVSTKIHRGEIPYPQDEKLRRQLCAVKHKQGAKKFELVKKEVTKRELGESPDRADTFVYGIWGTNRIPRPESLGDDFNRTALMGDKKGYGWKEYQETGGIGVAYGW